MDQNTAIEELHKLGIEVDSVTELPALKPIYFRLDQISKTFPDDFDVQVVVSELKQRLVSHGQKLKDASLGATGVISTGLSAAVERPGAEPRISTAQPPSSQYQAPPQQPVSSGVMPSIPTGFSQAPPSAVATPPSMQVRIPQQPTSNQSSPTKSQGHKPSGAGPNFKRTLAIGAGLGFVAFAAIAVFVVQMARNKNIDPKMGGGGTTGGVGGKVMVEFVTTPPGATIQVSGNDRQEKCVSNCKLELAAGSYQVTASLDGFNPSASGVVVDASNATPAVTLTLTPLAQSVKIISDVAGKVLLDGKPAGDLQEGQFILDRLPLGSHTISVQSAGAEATFTFRAEAGKAPVVSGPTTARNLLALLVATAGNQAKLYTSSPVKVKVDGQDRGEVGTAGSDLSGLKPGEHDLEAGEGKELKKLVVSVGEMPMLTAYLKSDVNAGFLVLVAGQEDGVALTIEGRLDPRRTQKGLMRVQLAPGKYRLRVAKDGFEPTAEQTVEIRKGEESKIAFALKALPKLAQLKITNATPGATVSLDRNPMGKVQPDGTFSATVPQLGDKVVEFTLAGFNTRQVSKTFKASETVTISTEGLLSPAVSTLKLTISPALPESKITIRREGDQVRNVTDANMSGLQPGSYLITASAKGYIERVERLALTGGETRPLDLTLKKEAVITPVAPVVRAGTIADLEGSFTRDGDAYIQKGPATVMFRAAQTQGVITFTVRPIRGKKIKWMIGQKDARTFSLFELEKNKLVRKDANGKKLSESAKFDPQDVFQVRIDIRNGAVIHQINIGGAPTTVDNWQDTLRNFADGRFGFIVDGKDEIAITDFRFTPTK